MKSRDQIINESTKKKTVRTELTMDSWNSLCEEASVEKHCAATEPNNKATESTNNSVSSTDGINNETNSIIKSTVTSILDGKAPNDEIEQLIIQLKEAITKLKLAKPDPMIIEPKLMATKPESTIADPKQMTPEPDLMTPEPDLTTPEPDLMTAKLHPMTENSKPMKTSSEPINSNSEPKTTKLNPKPTKAECTLTKATMIVTVSDKTAEIMPTMELAGLATTNLINETNAKITNRINGIKLTKEALLMELTEAPNKSTKIPAERKTTIARADDQFSPISKQRGNYARTIDCRTFVERDRHFNLAADTTAENDSEKNIVEDNRADQHAAKATAENDGEKNIVEDNRADQHTADTTAENEGEKNIVEDDRAEQNTITNATAENDGAENIVEDNREDMDTYTDCVNETAADKADKTTSANNATTKTDADKAQQISRADKTSKADNAVINGVDEYTSSSITNHSNQNQAADAWTAVDDWTTAEVWTDADFWTTANDKAVAEHCLPLAKLKRCYRNFPICNDLPADDEVELIGDVMMVLVDPPKQYNRHLYKQLPNFSGDPLDWTGWYKQYKKAVGDTDLDEIFKLAYLREKLDEKSEKMIHNYSSMDYEEALKLLNDEFTSPAKIMLTIRDYVQNLPTATEKQPVRETQSAINRLQSVSNLIKEHKIESVFEFSIFREFSSKLPKSMVDKYVKTLDNELPSLTDFLAIMKKLIKQKTSQPVYYPELLNESRTFEQTASKTTYRPEGTEKNLLNNSLPSTSKGWTDAKDTLPNELMNEPTDKLTDWKEKEPLDEDQDELSFPCYDCKSKRHTLQFCPFLTPTERLEIVEKHQLCHMCLEEGHRRSDCQYNLFCRWCGDRHNELICLDTELDESDNGEKDYYQRKLDYDDHYPEEDHSDDDRNRSLDRNDEPDYQEDSRDRKLNRNDDYYSQEDDYSEKDYPEDDYLEDGYRYSNESDYRRKETRRSTQKRNAYMVNAQLDYDDYEEDDDETSLSIDRLYEADIFSLSLKGGDAEFEDGEGAIRNRK